MAEQIKKPLPESLMKAITVTVQSPDLTSREKFEAVVLMAHGYGFWTERVGSIDPTAYAIPETQWRTIGELLQMTIPGGVDQVNMALEWMNIGPSSYKPEEGQ